MNANDPNVALIESAASALREVLDRVVFVGGCAVGLMITDAARPPVRATQDVDLIAEIGSKPQYYELANQLRAAGLKEDPDVVCRWRLGALRIDVMPTAEDILGFSNVWYPEAMRQAQTVVLPSGREIRLISPPLLLATKIEAFYGRGNGDFGASHDIEDIVNLIDGRGEIVAEVDATKGEVRSYLREELDDLLGAGLVDVVTWHLGPQPEDQARAELVIQRMRTIAGL